MTPTYLLLGLKFDTQPKAFAYAFHVARVSGGRCRVTRVNKQWRVMKAVG